MKDEQSLSAGELQAALSNAIVRIMREFYGKGAARSRTMIFDDYVFVVLEDVLTTAEMTLRNGGPGRSRAPRPDALRGPHDRHLRGRGGTTDGAHRRRLPQPGGARTAQLLRDLRARPDTGGSREAGQAAAPVEAADLQEPGQVGDVDQLPSPGEKAPPGGRAEAGSSQAGGTAVRAAISNAVVRLISELYGKGAARTRTFIADEHVFCALEGVLTTVERTLVEAGETELVRELRMRFGEMVRPVFAAEVGRLLGRQVLAVESQLVFDPDTLFLIFVLGDQRAPEPAAAAGEINRRQPSLRDGRTGRYHRRPVVRRRARAGPLARGGQSVGREAALRAAFA